MTVFQFLKLKKRADASGHQLISIFRQWSPNMLRCEMFFFSFCQCLKSRSSIEDYVNIWVLAMRVSFYWNRLIEIQIRVENPQYNLMGIKFNVKRIETELKSNRKQCTSHLIKKAALEAHSVELISSWNIFPSWQLCIRRLVVTVTYGWHWIVFCTKAYARFRFNHLAHINMHMK